MVTPRQWLSAQPASTVYRWSGPWRIVDASIALLTLILYSIAWPTLHLTHVVPEPIAPVVAAMAVAPLLLIRLNPVAGWGLSATSAMIIGAAFERVPGWDYPWQVVHLIVLPALLFAVAARASLPVVASVWASTMLLFVAQMPGHDGTGWAVGLSAGLAVTLLVRRLVHSRHQLAEQEQISDLERARRTILEEKARIARDLHDVVAHHMSMVVVAAQTAPYRLTGVSSEAEAEFEAIAASARAALNEIRGLLGVLRSDGAIAATEPAPSAVQVVELLEASKRSGLDVTWNVTGDATITSGTAGLVIYRIVQESVANAARHAVGAAIDVRIDYSEKGAALTVRNGPPVITAVHGVDGHGIAGMRDRAAAVGGTFTAGPTPDGGFAVIVHVPTTDLAVALR